MGQGSTAVRPFGQQIAFLPPKQIKYNTAGIASGIKIGTIPRGAKPFAFHQNTQFSSQGTRVLTVGTNSTAFDNIISTITEETASAGAHYIGLALELTQDTDVYVKMTTTGTVATTGTANIVVAFIPPMELS